MSFTISFISCFVFVLLKNVGSWVFWVPTLGTGASLGLRALSCKKSMPVSHPHSRYLQCLKESHVCDGCEICKDFKPQIQKDRMVRLCHLLIEAALDLSSEPSCLGWAPSISMSVRSASVDIVETRCPSPSPSPRKKHKHYASKEPASSRRLRSPVQSSSRQPGEQERMSLDKRHSLEPTSSRTESLTLTNPLCVY